MPTPKDRFCCNYSERLIDVLRQKGISYSVSDYRPLIPEQWVTFQVCKFDEYDKNFQMLILSMQITRQRDLSFTSKEMKEAEWFNLWCDNMKLEVLEEGRTTYKFYCAHGKNYYHREQIGAFQIGRPIKWRANHHWIAELGDSATIFCDSFAKKSFEENCIHGISFDPVYGKNMQQALPNVFQLNFKKILPTGEALEFTESPDCVREICPVCGKEQYVVTGAFQLQVKQDYLSPKQDAYATECIFGAGFACRKIVVSKRFYNIVNANSLGKNLHFEPIIIAQGNNSLARNSNNA